jgi:choline dehydrogenase-like flavoprotein
VEILDPHDNVPSEMKVGISREERHPGCSKREHSQDPLPVLSNADYDFVIVGGGSAGAVIATRIADTNPDVKVLILESGKNFIDDADAANESLEKLLKMEYCVPGQTADKCSPLSLPVHFSETPFMSAYPSMTNHSFYYQTTPQLYANKREMNYPRGKMLSGSSGTNNQISFRGHPEDYDDWAALGLPGWSYEELLPFFKRVESNSEYGQDSKVHGSDGPIHLVKSNRFRKFPVADSLIDTAIEKLGYPKVEDFNKGHDYYGAGPWQQYTNENGRRTSSYEYIRRLIKADRVCIDGFIAMADKSEKADLKAPQNTNKKTENSKKSCTSKQNLHILTEVHATQIHFDKPSNSKDKPRAVSVEYISSKDHPYRAVRPYPASSPVDEELKSRETLDYWNNDERSEVQNCPVDAKLARSTTREREWYIPPDTNRDWKKETKKVSAKREIILTAGAINSPQLLMLSGVGPKSHLKHQLGMKEEEIISDLPGLGTRILDHEEVTVNFKIPSKSQHWGPVKDLLGEADKWVKGGKDSVLSSNHAPGGMDISSEGPKGKKPTIHIHFLMFYFENLDYNIWQRQDKTTRIPVGLTDFAFWQGLQHYTALIERSGSCSRGLLRLKNRDPFLPPLVDMNYGSCNFTNQELIFGIKEMRKLNSLLPEDVRGEEVLPGPEYDTDEKLLNFIRNSVWGHHISGSAPMGHCSDNEAVLDARGRVYGVDGLRVADASSFPEIPHGNILYSVYVVAEKISDLILKDNGLNRNGPSLLNPKST